MYFRKLGYVNLKLNLLEVVSFNSLRTDGNFCHQGRDAEIGQKI
jgi:hypothetical protein